MSASTRCRRSDTAARRRRPRRTSTRSPTPESDSATPGRCPHARPAARCSSRAAIPLRTNVLGALGPNDLANSMVSPIRDDGAEAAEGARLPERAVRQVPSRPAGQQPVRLCDAAGPWAGTTSSAGWTRPAIRRRSTPRPGGVAPVGNVVLRLRAGSRGRRRRPGACYSPDDTCRVMEGTGPNPPGRACRDGGGIFDPDQSCQTHAASQYRLHDAERALRVAAGDQP